jgi:hypothetical protein
MAKLSDAEIASAASAGGFSGLNQAIAVAVALAESGGNATAIANEPDGSHSYGLWQINSVHPAVLSMGDWRDPATNARMAFRVFTENRGWTPWSTFNTLKYQLYMARSQTAVPNATGNLLGGATDTALDNIPGLSSAQDLLKLIRFVSDPGNWMRLSLVVLGMLLLGVAAIMLISHSDSFKQTVKTSVKAAKLAAVV